VARVSYQPDRTYTFSTRYRFDQSSFALRRFEIEGQATFERWNARVLYGSYDAQPLLGFLTRREAILGSGAVKLNTNWIASAALRYDIDAGKFDQTQFGIGYIDDCLIIALNYITNYTYSGNSKRDQRIMLQLSLRTLGSSAFGQTVGTSQGGL
jgi:LPS-assembly protein